MVTEVPKTKTFDGRRYYLQTKPGSGATKRNADALAKKLRRQGATYARRVDMSVLTAKDKKRGRKPHTEWHVYARNK